MFERLLNVIFWIGSLKSRSSDPILNEYRGYQRRMVISAGGMLFILCLGWLFFPEVPENNGFSNILAPILIYFEIFLDLLVIACCTIFLVNAVQFWRFCTKYGISD